MKVVVCKEPGQLELSERDQPTRQPGEALVRVRCIGVCGTDYHIFKGTQPYLQYPRVPGHELSAEIIEPDDQGRFEKGQLVCIMPYLSCGLCVACRKGKTNCCQNIAVLGVHRDGGLTEFLSVHPDFLIDAKGLSAEQAAMVEFLSIGHHAVERGAVSADERVLVVGAGPIGMAVSLFASIRGASVTVLDVNPTRAQFCVDKLGAAHAVQVGERADTDLARITDNESFDAVFDATGNPKAMEAGFTRVAHGGRYVLVSIVPADITFSDPEFHKRETTLLASRNATNKDFAAVIDAIRSGKVPTDEMHTHTASLEDVPAVIPIWSQPETGVIKGIVQA